MRFMKDPTGDTQQDIEILLLRLKKEDYCYLTTIGRVSGSPHEIEIWFALEGHTLYLLSGSDRSDWVRNLRAHPAVTVRIGEHTFTGQARIVHDDKEDLMVRYMLAEKYQEWSEDKSLSEWARTALPVAIDLTSSK
jgi:deazaflavin-dependent oxidoreductase (nitroreductase family)